MDSMWKLLQKLLFPKMVPLRDHRRIVRTLHEQIARERKRIEEINREKELLFRSSIKQATKNSELLERIEDIEKKVK